jgi:hypothetical protein
MQAILSLMQLIALRATGVSANRRRLAAVGFGITCCTPPRNGVKIELTPSGPAIVCRAPLSLAEASIFVACSQICFTTVANPIASPPDKTLAANEKGRSQMATPR